MTLSKHTGLCSSLCQESASATFQTELNVFSPKCCVFLPLSIATGYFIFVPTEQELHHSGLHFLFPLTSCLHNMSKIILTTKTKSTLRLSLTKL